MTENKTPKAQSETRAAAIGQLAGVFADAIGLASARLRSMKGEEDGAEFDRGARSALGLMRLALLADGVATQAEKETTEDDDSARLDEPSDERLRELALDFSARLSRANPAAQSGPGAVRSHPAPDRDGAAGGRA